MKAWTIAGSFLSATLLLPCLGVAAAPHSILLIMHSMVHSQGATSWHTHLPTSCHGLRLPAWCAGALLRSLTFPASIHRVLTDPADHALYAGAGDGSIFETSLGGGSSQAGGSGEPGPAEGGYHTLQGTQAAVTCLSMTTDASQLVSGEHIGIFFAFSVSAHCQAL